MALKRALLFFPAVAFGVALLVFAVEFRITPTTKPLGERFRLVDVMPLERQVIAPVVIGFGKVVPKVEWKAIAEVSGKLLYRHPQLEKGRVLPAGTEILRIDPLGHELKLTQIEADLSSSLSQLAKLTLEQSHVAYTLKIEKNRLSINKMELERQKKLRKKGLTSQSNVDQYTQSYLSQQKRVQEMRNQQALFPNEHKVALAKVKINQARLEEAQRLLDKTSVVLPSDLRISEVNIEQEQVVNLQQIMVIAHGIKTMEVDAQLSLHDMKILISSFGEFNHDDYGSLLLEAENIQAKIKLTSGSIEAIWKAKVIRIKESVAPDQATIGVVLEIERGRRNLKPEISLPLVKGMFVEAEITGQENLSWVIPERALHGNRIYIKDSQNKLRIESVTVLYRRDNLVVVNGDLKQGQGLILNDLLPAIEGMPLKSAAKTEGQE